MLIVTISKNDMSTKGSKLCKMLNAVAGTEGMFNKC